MFIKKAISTLSLVALVAVFGIGEAQALTSTGNLQVSGQVIGRKPVVTNIVNGATGDNTMINNATANVTITGLNFDTAKYVSLDDDNLTMLTSPVVVGPTQITATVPAGVVAGAYNVHVTNDYGTNISSDVKLSVSDPDPSADASIVSVSPSGAPVGWTQAFAVTVSDIDGGPVYWNTSLTVPATSTSGTIVVPSSDTMTGVTTSGVDHEGTFNSTFTADVAGAYKVTFNVDNDNAMGSIDDTKTITIYAISW